MISLWIREYPIDSLFYSGLVPVMSVIEFFFIKKVRNILKTKELSDYPDEERFNKLFDRYSRRLINWILISFLCVFDFLMRAVLLGVNSKASELQNAFFDNLLAFQIVAFFLIKNIHITKWLLSVYEYSKKAQLSKLIKRVLIGSAIYWIIGLLVFFGFEYVFVLDLYTFLTGIFNVAIIVLNLTLIRNLSYNKKKYVRYVLAVVMAIALVVGGYEYLSRDIWLTQPYINSIPNIYDSKCTISYDEESGIYTITKQEGDFKILQLTDIHLGGGALSYDKDMKALKAVYKLLDRTRPDFVIVTGDLVFPVGYASFSFNNNAPVQQFAAFMRNLGIPWAFTYGNHDTESYAAMNDYELDDLYKTLSWKTSKTLMYPYVQPDIMGRNNQLIELRNSDGSLNQALFLIDSNAYTGVVLSEL